MDGGGQRVGDGVGYPRKKSTIRTYSWTKNSIDKGWVHKLLKPFINLYMNIKMTKHTSHLVDIINKIYHMHHHHVSKITLVNMNWNKMQCKLC